MAFSAQGIVHRPLYFQSAKELRHYLTKNAPLALYMSLRLNGEDNQGNHHPAEVLVDVDCKPGPIPKGDGHPDIDAALAAAKMHMQRVLQILSDDLDIHPRHYDLVFSGSKGYHCILTHPDLQDLDARARRDLSNLLTGHDTRLRDLYPHPTRGGLQWPSQPPIGGLRRRIFLSIHRLHVLAQGETVPPAFVDLVDRHNDTTTPTATIVGLLARTPNPQHFLERAPHLHDVLYRLAQATSCAHIDAPVLSNVNGLRRVPGTLNGKTGLICQPIPNPQALERFDPFHDAAAFPFDQEHRIHGLKNRQVTAAGTTYTVQAEETKRLPTSIALAFVLSGAARFTADSD